MGRLAKYLQRGFVEYCPADWCCRCEQHVLPEEFERLLGYSPLADICLENTSTNQKLWIEFEISRADPVANHAKFATAHIFKPLAATDTFVSMVSSHVARGRRNLASNTIHLLRRIGISAYQTVLLPNIPPNEIKLLNHSSELQLDKRGLNVGKEISRVFEITEPVALEKGLRIHYAAELFEVIRNLYQWNSEIGTPSGANLWKRRTVKYFVYDLTSGQFAPSKFCAYVVPQSLGPNETAMSGIMDMQTYCSIDEGDRRFDGNRAQKHLSINLGMKVISAEETPEIGNLFVAWLKKYKSFITVHASGATFLMVPDWYH